MSEVAEDYNVRTAEGIQVLEGVECIRRRPAMYIGGTDARGVHQMFVEVSDNAVNEALSGNCDRIDVCLHQDGSLSVRDNGRGISAAVVASSGLPYIEDVFVRFTSKRFGFSEAESYRVSGGLHGIGVCVVAALSEWVEVETWNGGNRLDIEFRKGRTSRPLRAFKASDNRGTCVRWKPDSEIFSDVDFRPNLIAERLQELAGINRGLLTTFRDETGGNPDCSFHYPDGIQEFLKAAIPQQDAIHAPISFHGQCDDIIVDGALQFHDGDSHIFKFYSNAVPVRYGVPAGSLKEAVSRAVSIVVPKLELSLPRPVGVSIWKRNRPSVSCVMSIRLWKPFYTSAIQVCLDNPEVHRPVFRAVYSALTKALQDDSGLATALLQRISNS